MMWFHNNINYEHFQFEEKNILPLLSRFSSHLVESIPDCAGEGAR